MALLGQIRVFAIRVQDVHRLEVESAHSAHESLLQVILHVCFGDLAILDELVRLVKSLSEHLDLFAVVGTDVLDFGFHGALEVLFVFLHFPHFVLFEPCLQDGAGLLFSKFSHTVLQHVS